MLTVVFAIFTFNCLDTVGSQNRPESLDSVEYLTNIFTEPCLRKEHLQILHPEDSLDAIYTLNLHAKNTPVCLTATTNKNSENLELLRNASNALSVSSQAWFRLTRLGECEFCNGALYCEIKFHGYQGIYRLSPDFGYYKSCNSIISRHSRLVAQYINRHPDPGTVYSPPYGTDCPLSELPLHYEVYSSCALKANAWYLADFQSRTEFEHKNYTSPAPAQNRQFLVFKTTNRFARAFEPVDSTRLMSVKYRRRNCELSIFLHLNPTSSLPFDIRTTIGLIYFYPNGTRIGAVSNDNGIELGKISIISDETINIILGTRPNKEQWEHILYRPCSPDNVTTSFDLQICHKSLALVHLRTKNVSASISAENFDVCKMISFQNCTLPTVIGRKNGDILFHSQSVIVIALFMSYFVAHCDFTRS